MAGHRLNRVLGGQHGHFALDQGWSAYFTRCNESCVVATYPSHQDATEAVRAAEASKVGIIELCGGKLNDVTLANLSKYGAEVQQVIRKASGGFGRVAGAGTKQFDFTSIQISPEQLSDDKAQVEMRNANDVTNAAQFTAITDLFSLGSSKADLVGEGVRGVKAPAAAFLSTAGASIGTSAEEAVTAANRCARPSHALLGLIPSNVLDCASEPPSPVVSRAPSPAHMDDDGDDDEQQHLKGNALDFGLGQRDAGNAAIDDFNFEPSSSNAGGKGGDGFASWEPSAEAVTAEEDWGPPPPAPVPEATVTIRIAAQLQETVTINSKAGSPDTAITEGNMAIKYMYAGTLSEAVQATGHGPLQFYLALRSPAPLASVTFTPSASSLTSSAASAAAAGAIAAAAAAPVHIQIPQQPAGTVGPVLTLIPLTLPIRAANATGNAAKDLGTLVYKYPSSYVPPVLKAQALSRLTFAPAAATATEGQQHKFTDVLMRTMLAPTVTAVASQVSFLLQLPPCPSSATPDQAAGAALPEYGEALGKPQCQWMAYRSQLLWALTESEGAPPAGVSESDVPRVKTYFQPGKPIEFKARIPISNGITVQDTNALPTGVQAVTPIPLQMRFMLNTGTVAGALPEAPAAPGPGGDAGSGIEQPQTVDDVCGHKVRILIAGVLVKTSSQVRGMFK